MNKSHRLILGFIATFILFAATSCKDELARINKNPNAVEQPDPAYLLTGAIKTATDVYWNIGASDQSGGNPADLFVQYWAAIQYTDQDRYIFSSNSFKGLWTTLYSGGIVNLDEIIRLAREEKNTNYEGVALTFRSWAYSLLTDAFGAIPYSQSIDVESHPTPQYDPQKKVYEGILADLKKADSLLNPKGKAIEGDIIYNGDISLWKKFTNSLRLRIALRIADKEPERSRKVIENIRQENGQYISSNSEIARLYYVDPPNDNPLYELFLTRDDYRISETVVDKLSQLNDPRLSIYAAPTEDPSAKKYVGVPNGLLNGDASELGISKTSKPGAYFLAPHAPAVFMSYAEVLFDRAEAAARGFSSENAEALYKQAITASMKQYEIGDAAIARYLAQPKVQYDESNYKKSIGVQKWIALFGQGLEAFAEWRRLDYPQLSPAVAGVLNGQIPLRFIYPGTEQSLNGKNYKKAVNRQGADLLTTRLWFDVH